MRSALARSARPVRPRISAHDQRRKSLDHRQVDHSVNPSAPNEIVGKVAEAGIPEAERAVKAARAAFAQWCRTLSRASRAAARTRGRNHGPSPLRTLRARGFRSRQSRGREADGDIREAMDFCSSTPSRCASWAGHSSPSTCRAKRTISTLAARRRARDRAVEFPARHSDRHGLGRARHRQHRHHETGRAVGRYAARC